MKMRRGFFFLFLFSRSRSRSRWFRHLPGLSTPRHHVPHLLPTDRHHGVPLLRRGDDDAELIARGADVVVAFVAQRDHARQDNVADAVGRRQRGARVRVRADVFLAQDGLELQLVVRGVRVGHDVA